jgi:serine/threonine protein phosphatase PrpC
VSRRESPFHLDIAGATHIGSRQANEDHYRYDEELGLLAIADGVSFRPAGRIAAETTIEALFAYMIDPNMTSPADPRERIERAFAHVHRHVREQAAAEPHLRGMATTLACAMERGKLLLVGNVGDSRVTRFREGRLERLTTDHCLGTDPLSRVRIGLEASPGSEANALTRAIGLEESITTDVCLEALRPNDGILLSTDGLTAVVDDETIVATIKRVRTPRAIVNELIRCALAQGAPDNTSCVYGLWRPILP